MRTKFTMTLTLTAVAALCVSGAHAQSTSEGQYDYSDYYADYYADEEAVEEDYADNGQAGSCTTCDTCYDGCSDGCPNGCGDGGFFGGGPGLITVSGWVNGGATLNDHSVGNNPQNFINNGGNGSNFPVRFNDREQGQLNQVYLIFGREVDTSSRGWDVGGQIDLLYGSDARFTQALGLDDNIISDKESLEYKAAIPQLYASFGLGDLEVWVGHFYTIIGYEVVPAPGNFFYSHAYTLLYGEPFTHTGVLGQYGLGEFTTLYGGWVRGWDNWEDNNGNQSYLGGIVFDFGDNTSLAVTGITGNEDDAGANNRTLYSVVAQQGFGPFRVVIQHDNGWEDNGSGVVAGQDAEWYGINQYLFFDWNDQVSFGTRFEWFRDDDGARVGFVDANGMDVTFGDNDYYEITFGANIAPTDFALIRPEVRWDWQQSAADSATSQNAFAQGTERSQFTAAVDFIITY